MWISVIVTITLQTGICQPFECTLRTGCSSCSLGYFFHSSWCHLCPQGCLECTWSDNCTSCNEGYFWYNHMCHACPQHCKVCSMSDTCNICYYCYYLNRRVCQSCPQGCATCSLSFGCKSCNNQYYLDGIRCYPCPQNCEACSSKDIGKYCEDRCNDRCLSCDKATGECTDCGGNAFGRYCELNCSRNCQQLPTTNSSCYQHNGTCTAGCIQGFTKPDCYGEIPSQSSENAFVIVGSIFIGIVIMVIVGIILWRRRVNRADLKAGGEHSFGAQDPLAVNEYMNQAYTNIDNDPVPEPGHHSNYVATCIDVTYADQVNAAVQKQSKLKPGQPWKTRGQSDRADNVYDVASAGHSQYGAYKSRSEAEGDEYSHINHTFCLRKHRYDNEGTYDHVTRQSINKGDAEDTYDVTGGQTSRNHYHTVKATDNKPLDEYSTIGNLTNVFCQPRNS